MNILCLDYGKERIGAAIASGPLAEPVEIISNRKKANNSSILSKAAMEQITTLIRHYKIEQIVVGVSEGKMAEDSREFAEILHNNKPIPVVLIDETLSTVEATQLMSHMKKSKRRGGRDHFAAAVMLQEYLDRSHINSDPIQSHTIDL